MRRRTGRSLPNPCPPAPNRSGDGAPRSPARQSVMRLLERVPQVELAAARRVVDAGLALVLGREALALARVVGRAPVACGGGVVRQVVGAARVRAAVRPGLMRHPGV